MPHLVSGFYELFGCFINIPYYKSLIQICIIAFVENRDIHVHNIPVLKRPLIWNPMANDLDMKENR